jgi:hypothetical protein
LFYLFLFPPNCRLLHAKSIQTDKSILFLFNTAKKKDAGDISRTGADSDSATSSERPADAL